MKINFDHLLVGFNDNQKKLFNEYVLESGLFTPSAIPEKVQYFQNDKYFNLLQALDKKQAIALLKLEPSALAKKMTILSELYAAQGEISPDTVNFIMDDKNQKRINTLYSVCTINQQIMPNQPKLLTKENVGCLINNKMPHFDEIIQNLIKNNTLTTETLNTINDMNQKRKTNFFISVFQYQALSPKNAIKANEINVIAQNYLDDKSVLTFKLTKNGVKEKRYEVRDPDKGITLDNKKFGTDEFTNIKNDFKNLRGRKLKADILLKLEENFDKYNDLKTFNEYLKSPEFKAAKKVLTTHQKWYGVGRTDAQIMLNELIQTKRDVLKATANTNEASKRN